MMGVFTSEDVLVRIQPTPNPNAWKFVMNFPVLNQGKLTYTDPEQAILNRLAFSLFQIDGIRQVHFFKNVITVTHAFDYDIDELQESIISVIKTRLPVHNPEMTTVDEKKAARDLKPPEVQQIEEILDRTVRPALQGDGGDIEVVEVYENKVFIKYEGACGTCPSSTTGTLSAIEGILRDELERDMEVVTL